MWLFIFGCTAPKSTDSAEASPQCVDESLLNTTFEPFPDTATTQIHADVTFDGEHIWVVFNLPNESNTFDVYLAALDCQGEIYRAPEQILDIPNLNQTTPRIAYTNGNVMVASQGDNGNGSNNLSIHIHVQDTAGNLIREQEWVPVINGIETGNRWLPSIVGTEDGFWLAAAVANQTHFRTAVQRIATDGTFVGSAHWAGEDSYAVFPNIDGTDEGYVVGWENGEDGVGWTTGNTDGSDESETVYDNSAGIDVLWNDGNPIIFSHRKSPLAVLINDEQHSELGGTYYPNAVQGSQSIFTGYFRLQSGYQNDVYGSLLDTTESVLQPLSIDTLLQSTPSVAPYKPAVTHLGNDQYFVLWSQGSNPEFRLAGQFIDMSSF